MGKNIGTFYVGNRYSPCLQNIGTFYGLKLALCLSEYRHFLCRKSVLSMLAEYRHFLRSEIGTDSIANIGTFYVGNRYSPYLQNIGTFYGRKLALSMSEIDTFYGGKLALSTMVKIRTFYIRKNRRFLR